VVVVEKNLCRASPKRMQKEREEERVAARAEGEVWPTLPPLPSIYR
jgi:hypothetical protein